MRRILLVAAAAGLALTLMAMAPPGHAADTSFDYQVASDLTSSDTAGISRTDAAVVHDNLMVADAPTVLDDQAPVALYTVYFVNDETSAAVPLFIDAPLNFGAVDSAAPIDAVDQASFFNSAAPPAALIT